jgi:hypothetical protein
MDELLSHRPDLHAGDVEKPELPLYTGKSFRHVQESDNGVHPEKKA